MNRDSQAQPSATLASWPRIVAIMCALALLLISTFGIVATANACPDCAVGVKARAEVWSDDFAFNLLFALMPFLIIGAICISIENARSVRPLGPRSRGSITNPEHTEGL